MTPKQALILLLDIQTQLKRVSEQQFPVGTGVRPKILRETRYIEALARQIIERVE